MPQLLAAGTPLPVSIEDLSRRLSLPEDKTLLPQDMKSSKFSNLTELIRYLGNSQGTTLVLLVDDLHVTPMEALKFMASSKFFYKNTYVLLLTGDYSIGPDSFSELVVGIGESNFCDTIYSLCKNFPSLPVVIKRRVGALKQEANSERVIHHKKVVSLSFKMIVPLIYCCFKVTESKLLEVLEDVSLVQETRVLTALLYMFPYIEKHLKMHERIFVIQLHGESNPANKGMIGEGIQQKELEGKRLTMLAVYLLGPAYSTKEKMPGQIARSTQAVAALNQIKHFDAARTADIINAIQWKVDEMPVVYDALSWVVCILQNGDYNPEVPSDQLASEEYLVQQSQISKQAGALLKQARLAYVNYRCATLKFIPPALPEIKSIVGRNFAMFNTEMDNFELIQKIVETAPYIGLRSKIPEKFHIERYAKLAYCGRVYHEHTLKTQHERQSFAKYNMRILNKIKNLGDRETVKILASTLCLDPVTNPTTSSGSLKRKFSEN